MPTQMPLYQHDCDECIFVGADSPEPGEPRCNQVDMYVHLRDDEIACAIRRYSSEGSDYGAMSHDGLKIPKYQRVIAAWKESRHA